MDHSNKMIESLLVKLEETQFSNMSHHNQKMITLLCLTLQLSMGLHFMVNCSIRIYKIILTLQLKYTSINSAVADRTKQGITQMVFLQYFIRQFSAIILFFYLLIKTSSLWWKSQSATPKNDLLNDRDDQILKDESLFQLAFVSFFVFGISFIIASSQYVFTHMIRTYPLRTPLSFYKDIFNPLNQAQIKHRIEIILNTQSMFNVIFSLIMCILKRFEPCALGSLLLCFDIYLIQVSFLWVNRWFIKYHKINNRIMIGSIVEFLLFVHVAFNLYFLSTDQSKLDAPFDEN